MEKKTKNDSTFHELVKKKVVGVNVTKVDCVQFRVCLVSFYLEFKFLSFFFAHNPGEISLD